ncbi:hypothetical protein ALC57_08754 [Trachymyrmex cornetzi]|uniref:Uncharacterized protein n=1 Tax=Trachymyrmex cornetzi TaxID=471704 RepID=A0A195E1D5_9HYME|nr:hypothetical protein ALC57_08754 [Trachymyrmex cornetzi]
MIRVPRITIQSKRLWGVVKTGTVDCARLESRGETLRKLALRRYAAGRFADPKQLPVGQFVRDLYPTDSFIRCTMRTTTIDVQKWNRDGNDGEGTQIPRITGIRAEGVLRLEI